METDLHYSVILVVIFLAAIAAYLLKKIDLIGGLSGAMLASIIWLGGGPESLFALFLFFVFASIASHWRIDNKKQDNLVQENQGIRGISNVMANGGVAGLLSLLALFQPEHKHMLIPMIIAVFATACSDTLSSELGNVYGKRYFTITNFKPATRGIDGAVSLQGLWFGLAGSLLIATGTFLFYHDYRILLVITISGLSGNIVYSILGATIQRRGIINNHQVNFFATLSGSFICLLLL